MRLARFEQKGKVFYGICEDEFIYPIEGEIYSDFKTASQKIKLSDVKLMAPCNPTKVVCVGLNYKDHIQEMGLETPTEPTIFMKPATAVIGNNEEIIYPEMSAQVDYEAELAVVIKNRIKNINPNKVYENILGYTCGNDVTARDLQQKDGQWTRAKSFDTFCPLGPWIETEVDPASLDIKAYLNGELRQSSNTSFLLFPVEELVSFISRVMTLNPGDVIMTGTPSGVGAMKPGDVIEISIDGIGTLKNRVCPPTNIR